MAKSEGINRAEAIQRMSGWIKAGRTRTSVYKEMAAKGKFVRKQTFFADWRKEAGIEKQKDAIKYVRKGYFPTGLIAQAESWKMSTEYLYKVKVHYRMSPGEPITERFVNVGVDNPIRIEEAEWRAAQLWETCPEKAAEVVTSATVAEIITKKQ